LKKNTKQYFWIIFTILLTACGNISSELNTNTAPTSMSVFTLIEQTPTALPTETPVVPSLTSVPGTLFPLDELRMAYVIDGNLYLQDGSNLPIQLTYNGEDQEPLISDDGKKIVFFRGKSADHVYVINADGSQEQLLITNSLLNERGLRYDEASEIRTFRSLAFVPGTHILLFNAYQIDPHDLELKYKNHVYAIGLFLVDIDSGKIRQLLAPGLGGSFKISPDGNLLSVITSGHIDIFGIDGQVIRRNLVTYTPSKPIELFPVFYWLPDSTGLIVSLLVESQYDIGDMPTYAIWRYPLDGNMAIQIPLDPPPMGTDAHISPDKKWLIYNREPDKEQKGVPLYLGDLRNSSSRLYMMDAFARGWSPDNIHFICEGNKRELFLGSIDKPPTYAGEGNFLGWVDTSHYIYASIPNMGNIMIGEIDGETINIQTFKLKTLSSKSFSWFIFVSLTSDKNK